jgi:hypothetical protein
MACYRIHRMKDIARQSFRWAAHTAGLAEVKPRDYDPETAAVEAASVYSAWSQMEQGDSPLQVGDLLEEANGSLRIFKYVGFEEACWVLPEVKSGLENLPPAVGAPEAGIHAS